MKKALLTTTALVALSGAAFADSVAVVNGGTSHHTHSPTVVFHGTANINYTVPLKAVAGPAPEGAVASDVDLDVTMTSLGAYSATITYGMEGNNIAGATVTVTTPLANISVGVDDNARSFTLKNAVSSDVILRIENDVNQEDTGLEIYYNGSSSTRTFRMGGRVIANNDDMQYVTSEGARFYVDSSREAININANARVMHYSNDNTMLQSSIAGAVRMQLSHTGGGDVTFSNPSSGSATYSTSSDYRLKQDVVALPNALTTVKALKPYQYTWKHNTSKTSQGFFAHELLETTPKA